MKAKTIKNLDKNDKDIVEKLIGCKFDILKIYKDGGVILDICDGIKLKKEEYEIDDPKGDLLKQYPYIKKIPYPVKDLVREESIGIANEALPYNVEKNQILTESEFKKYKNDNEPMIEDIFTNADYYGYKSLTICFKNDTADEVYMKID